MAEHSLQNEPKVFISYSRKDEEFAEDLLNGLEAAGFDAYLDKHDIAVGQLLTIVLVTPTVIAAFPFEFFCLPINDRDKIYLPHAYKNIPVL